MEIYQQALVRAIEQTANGQLAVTEYLTRLAQMKALQVYDYCMGKTFRSEEMKCEVMPVAVSYRIRNSVWDRGRCYSKYDRQIIYIEIAFVADVGSILESKRRQLTDAERKYLKELKKHRCESKDAAKGSWWRRGADSEAYERVISIGRKLEELKSKLKVVESAEWTWELSDITSDMFMKKGMSYDGQTICEGERG